MGVAEHQAEEAHGEAQTIGSHGLGPSPALLLVGHLVSLGYHDLEWVCRAEQDDAKVPKLSRKALMDLWRADRPPA